MKNEQLNLTSHNEMIDILNLFKNDLTDSQYTNAYSSILAGKANILKFDEAVSSEDQKTLVNYFGSLS